MHSYSGTARSARQTKPAVRTSAPNTLPPIVRADPPWRETALLPLKRVAHVLGVSVAGLYRLEQGGTLKFRRLGGRTLVRTEGVIALADADEPWTPSAAGAAARSRRNELASGRAAA